MSVSYSGMPRGRRQLEGQDRGLDGIIGLIVLLASLSIGALSLNQLYLFGLANVESPGAYEGVQIGFLIAVIGSALFFGITTITYLARIARGRRSWSAPLWGLILMSAALIFGYVTMASGL